MLKFRYSEAVEKARKINENRSLDVLKRAAKALAKEGPSLELWLLLGVLEILLPEKEYDNFLDNIGL